jgi:hypothetical protein
MKKTILFLLIVLATTISNAQSLKEALYGGKLKTDTGSVLRKGDDLSSKIDSSRKKEVVPEKKMDALSMDSIKKWTTQPDSSAVATVIDKTNSNAVTKDNNKLWKEFVDSLISTLNQEVMTSKKINKGNYYITVDYAIATDGQVAITNVLLVPENKFLQEQIRERLSIDTPRLNPVLAGNGAPRKVTKRYNFTLTKE